MFTTDVRSICWRQVVAARSLISCQKFKEELLPPPILLHTSSEEEKEKVSDLHQSVLATSKSVYRKDRKCIFR